MFVSRRAAHRSAAQSAPVLILRHHYSLLPNGYTRHVPERLIAMF